jgi:hypothetical protein
MGLATIECWLKKGFIKLGSIAVANKKVEAEKSNKRY